MMSVASFALNYKYENGRRYHAFKEGEYPVPNDIAEQDRMDLHHHVCKLIIGGNLFRAPLSRSLHRVLDLGTGTGIWAIDFADEFPSAVVVGNDLSPIQPFWVPQNCNFVVEDIEADWGYKPSEKFDFVHARSLGGSIKDRPKMYRQAFNHLKPGGWLELQAFDISVRSDDDPELKKCPTTKRWREELKRASLIHGKKLNTGADNMQLLIDAGFVDVHDDAYKTPLGPWAKDKRLKEIGLYNLENVCDGVESYTMALMTRSLGWSASDTQTLIDGVVVELRNYKVNRLYWTFHFTYGQKPEK
jgi:SAM-dependent methyltransferase